MVPSWREHICGVSSLAPVTTPPPVLYAQSGDVHIAYQVSGDESAGRDIVLDMKPGEHLVLTKDP